MKNRKKNVISVIVPVFKAEEYLNRCVESLLSQTYNLIEIILIDDASPDNCPELCDNYAKSYNNFKVIHLENSGIGVSRARNVGLENATGEFVAFVDSDDYVHNEIFSYLIELLIANKSANMAMCSYQKFNESIIEFEDISKRDEIVFDDMDAMNLIIDDQNMSAVWGKLYRSSVFEDLRFPDGRHNEDMFLMPYIFQNAKKIVYAPKPLYYYFQNNKSLCRSDFDYNKLDMIYAIQIWKEHISAEFPILDYKVKSHYYSSIFNICQYLANKNDPYGHDIFHKFQQEINSNFYYILGSKYISFNNKLKLVLFKTRLFRYFFRVVHYCNIRNYN